MLGASLLVGTGLMLATAGPAAASDVQLATPSSGEVTVLGGASKVCTRSGQDVDVWCDLEVPGTFPGGTVHVDVDVSGPDRASREWSLYVDFRKVCRAPYTANDPARSWTCRNVPRGKMRLSASKPPWEQAAIGVRW
ncbi:hypothetical protein [Lentzea atacamensis]|uniref:hypothetical protein n=1 Tax=Lentzea atacamensis TaxID=531938 RepID=UPI000D6B4E1A|nr:hypothetical protein [Lentzea atacamensis]